MFQKGFKEVLNNQDLNVLNEVLSSDKRTDFRKLAKRNFIIRIPTVKLKISGKVFLKSESRTYIQVIVFDLSYLPVATVGTSR